MSTAAGRLAAATVTALLLSACGGTAGGSNGNSLTVVAGFYPLQWVAERIGGETIEVSSLTPPGAEAHDLELTPQDVAAVSEADLVVFLGGFQPAVDEAAESEGGDRAWDVAEDAADPHFWLDPTRLAAVGDALAERLAEIEPDAADTFERNAAALRTDLEELDQEFEADLADCAVRTLVTAHDAFGYLADRYGLEVHGIGGLSPSQEPEAAQLAEIAELVADQGVTTVYTETLVDPAVAETVAAEAGVRTAVLDPVEGLTDESAGEDYLTVMRANLATLRDGQSCP